MLPFETGEQTPELSTPLSAREYYENPFVSDELRHREGRLFNGGGVTLTTLGERGKILMVLSNKLGKARSFCRWMKVKEVLLR